MATYYYGIWFVGDGESQDWLGKLFKEGGKSIFEFRFRYYNEEEPDNKPFSGKDRKNWYQCKAKDDSEGTLNSLLPIVEAAATMTGARYGQKPDFIKLECLDSDPKFFFELGSRPWANMKLMTADEAKAQGYIP